MSERLLCSCDRFCEAMSKKPEHLQISRWQFGADSSIILEFIALRVRARGDGPFVYYLQLHNSTNATLTGQEEEGYVQLKVS